MSDLLEVLRRRIGAKHSQSLADLESRQRVALHALEAIAHSPESVRALEAILGFLEGGPPARLTDPANDQAASPAPPATWAEYPVQWSIRRGHSAFPVDGEWPTVQHVTGHRNSAAADDVLEIRIEEILCRAGISYRKTKRAERITGFDLAPDFVVPDEFNPRVVIEAKITEDDGTARDKITRVQHLDELSRSGMPPGAFKYEVIACIGGRGFGIRREDMKKLLLATRGKVFTLKQLDRLVECSTLQQFRTK